MACDTFLKITQDCGGEFVIFHTGDREPFVNDVLRNMVRITADLNPQQVGFF
jgi:exportin-1